MTGDQVSQLDHRIAGEVEHRVPLVRQPYAQLAAILGSDEQTLLEHLARLRAPGGVVREISGIFDAKALGYRQALVAMRLPTEAQDRAGRIAAAHPGVSHCYGRDGAYNVWFTLATSPQSALHLERTAEVIARAASAVKYLVLPTIRRYKLDVRFARPRPEGGCGEPPSTQAPKPGARAAAPPTEEQIRAIRALQHDLPNTCDPFAPLAETERLDADMLLVHAADLLATGWMRRYAAVLHHRAAGAEANVLVAWRVGEQDADAAGAACSRAREVSHCYLRPAADDWPYNLYTMVHGRDRADCGAAIERIAPATHQRGRVELWTVAEYKKRRIRLFGTEESRWEREYA